MVLPTVLKKRHSMKGLKLVPLIKRIRDGKPESLKEYARMTKDRKTNDLDMEEIANHVKAITGETLDDMFVLTGRNSEDEEEARWILHSIIIYANEYGQPKGQDLSEEDSAVAGTSGFESSGPKTGTSEPKAGSSEPKTGKRKRDSAMDLEDRISCLEKSAKSDYVTSLKEKVRTLCLQQDPSDSLIFLTLDELSKVARKANHKEADIYEELARQANRYSSKLEISNLCLSVIGGKAADTITKAISKCLKEKQSSQKNETMDKQNENVSKRESPLANLNPTNPQGPSSLSASLFSIWIPWNAVIWAKFREL